MKKYIFVFSVFVIFFSINKVDAQKIKTVEIQTSAQCEMCKERIESNLAFERGIKDVHLNMDTKKLTITYKSSKTDIEEIKHAITKLGYDAEDYKADEDAYKKLPLCCQKPKDKGDVNHH